MPEPLWKSIRLALLAATFVGAALTIGRSFTLPAAKSEAKQPVTALAPTVPLPGWQSIGSTPIQPESPKEAEAANRSEAEKEAVPGQRYQYRQNQTNLEVEVRQMVGDGNNSRFLFVYSPVRAANAGLQIRTLPGVGSYGILAHQGRAYLSACINSRGDSTVTEQEFKQNSYRHDLRPDRVVSWFMGQTPLLDDRCLWTLMSTPLPLDVATNSTATEATFKTLETAWSSWHQWWRSNYPSN